MSGWQSPPLTGLRGPALLISLCGALVYALFASGLFAPRGTVLFGGYFYNYYFLSLLEGRFDIPMRVASLEGHYDAQGRAFVYHGIGPMLTRVLAAPLVDLRAVPLAAASVWFWAVLGTGAIYGALVRLIAAHAPPEARRRLVIWAGALVWLAGPGLLLSANGSLYNEAISLGFFCAAVWLALAVRVAGLGMAPAAVLLPMAVVAGLAVHARVPLAVGLYGGTLVMIAAHLRLTGARALGRPVAVLAILFAFGALFLALNAVRFGHPLRLSGSNVAGAAGAGDVIEYGFAYWGVNPPEAPQLSAFLADGTFSLKRLGPNAFLYFLDVPKTALSDRMLALYREMTAHLGFMRVQAPRVGMVWLWAAWMALPLAALLAPGPLPGQGRAGDRVTRRLAAAALVLATALPAVMMLCYGTMTLRYRVDMWPALGAPAVLALPRLLAHWPAGPRWLRPGMGLLLAGGIAMSLATAVAYSKASQEVGIFSFWDLGTCRRMTAGKGFAPDRIETLCAL